MPRYAMPPLSKSYSELILHYLIRHPCSTASDVVYAIGGCGSTIRKRLSELCDEEGITDYRWYPRITGKLWYVNDEWLDYALRCKGDY